MKIKNKNKLISYLLIAVVFWFACWKAKLGLHTDEVHTLSVGDMIARGDSFFKETWFYLQMSAVFNAPVISLYRMITGSLDGIIYFMRIVTLIIQAIVTYYFHRTFSKTYDRRFVAAAAFMFFAYTPDFLSVIYKQEILWFALLISCYMYRYYESSAKKYVVYSGLCTSGCVLAYPTSVIFAVFVIAMILVINTDRQDKSKGWKDTGIFVLVCALCGSAFLTYIFITIGVGNFLHYFPIVFMDSNLDRNFMTKWIYPLIKMFIMGGFVLIPCAVARRFESVASLIRRFKIPVISVLMVLAFAGQIFIERNCITWHVINYPYSITTFVSLWIAFKAEKKEEKAAGCILFWTTWVVIACMILASNQGNITCMYGTIFTSMLLVMQMGSISDEKKHTIAVNERIIIAVTATVIAVLTFVVPVYEHESTSPYNDEFVQTNIFSTREKAEYGPAKGLYLGRGIGEIYNSICEVMDENVHKDDKLCIIDMFGTSLGYMYSDAEYAIYSSQGGFGVKDNDRIVEYYNENPHKIPTVVIIGKDYIKVSLEEYMDAKPFGGYLSDNGYKICNETDEYWVLRK